MWQPQINYFKDETILTYDLLGHGKSKCNKNNIKKIDDFSDQLIDLISKFKIEKITSCRFLHRCFNCIDFASEYKKYLNSLTLLFYI